MKAGERKNHSKKAWLTSSDANIIWQGRESPQTKTTTTNHQFIEFTSKHDMTNNKRESTTTQES